MQRPLGAEISHMLKDRGIDVIFGIPGVHNQEMYRGIEEAGITHVLARHEQGAGFMADGYARASGKPGVVYVITGPGLCNTMTPMGQAYSDSVPLLVISSCLDETSVTKGQLHQMKDQRAAAETVCDWSLQAQEPLAVYDLIDRALSEFSAARKRPKHIQVPIAALEARADPAPARAVADIPMKPQASEAILDEIAAALKAASNPIILYGGGAVCAGNACEQLADRTGAAVFTTYAGRGLMSPGHDLTFGSLLARPESADVFAQADLLVAIGTEIAEVDLWRSALGHKCRSIRIDIDPSQFSHPHFEADITVVADAADVIRNLNQKLGSYVPNTNWRKADVLAFRRRQRAEIDAERPGIVAICDALRDVVPDDAMIYSDMTQFAYVAKEVWDMPRAGHWHHPYGFGTLGYATPAAIGGAIARPDLPTLAIIGDYGFQYTVQELGVAVELGLHLPILLWDNGKLKEIEDSMVRAQIAPNAVVARNPDFCKLAEAFGAASAAPASLDELKDAVTLAFQTDGPTLIYMTPGLSA